jgi:hypothetical protein
MGIIYFFTGFRRTIKISESDLRGIAKCGAPQGDADEAPQVHIVQPIEPEYAATIHLPHPMLNGPFTFSHSYQPNRNIGKLYAT